jgi:hypothetical protein
MPDIAITIRIPEDLKRSVDACSDALGLSQADVVRQALQRFIEPRPERVYELPGMSAAFTEFLKVNGWVLLLVDAGPARFQVEGQVQRQLTNASIVALVVRGAERERPTAFLRRDVVAWYPGDERADQLAPSLLERGWERFNPRRPLTVRSGRRR